MVEVHEILILTQSTIETGRHAGIIIGGDKAKVDVWPVNPDEEPLVLVATIDCAVLKKQVALATLPDEGYLSLFTTCSTTEYFLDNITYSGDPSDLQGIRAGYTAVIYSDGTAHQRGAPRSVPVMGTQFQRRCVADDEFPVFSLCSSTPPRGLKIPGDIALDYEFVLQLYSADFPDPYKDIFYLTDAIAYLLLKKDCSGEGLFFVQTA